MAGDPFYQKLMLNLLVDFLSWLLLSGDGSRKNILSIFEDILNGLSSEKINNYEIHYLAGGLYKVLIEWIENGLEETAEEIAKIICGFTNK